MEVSREFLEEHLQAMEQRRRETAMQVAQYDGAIALAKLLMMRLDAAEEAAEKEGTDGKE